ncbi:hypothetical protein [Ancylobacter sp. IITR112]|uniref:hypothetical protein n=1 Tax=Ancylobacter sp. IITR112 TaxID=3138073 RepID=UPI00352B34B0
MCSCTAEINALLARHNTAIVANPVGPARACVSTHPLRVGERFEPPALMATYCPFCGESYDAEAPAVPFHREGNPAGLVDEDITF